MPSPRNDPNATAPATDKPAAPASQDKPNADAGQTITAKTDDAVDAKAGTYTVAAGRTVSHGEDGETTDYGPGDRVKLTKAEATRLLKGGYILDKDGAAIIQADGPATNVEDGVQLAAPGA